MPAGHFDGKRFYNPDARRAPGWLDALRWKLNARPELSPRFIDDVVTNKPAERGSGLKITLVNHSTALIQHAGCNILTDPVWGERVSPLSWIGPRRRRKPGILWEDLPRIDIVVISHNHYDHLELASLRRLAARGDSTFIIPRGVGELFRSEKIGPFEELDWGGRWRTIHCVPAVHFSSRGLFDRNRTLWCGYVMECQGRLVYFAGDTAFGSHFAEIHEEFGRTDVALLPIGAYEPRWFMSPVHMGPEEAAQAHGILDAKMSIAIHHGTFQLGDEGIDTPKRVLRKSAPDSFTVLNNGEFVDIP
jgi:L-ascorbate metabolism protein UlaG (beta-lactamase superfamily)